MTQTGHLTLAAVGKLKEAYWKAAQDEYLKRLQRYTHFHLVEVKDVVGRGMPDGVAMKREGEALTQAVVDVGYKIALTPIGKPFTSPQLAEQVGKWLEEYGRIAFLIGSPSGFSDQVLASCHLQLSLSSLTFPHELARIVLLEQLYRAFTILNGEKYHK